MKIGDTFATQLTWSAWTAIDERTCEITPSPYQSTCSRTGQARLVYVTTEGYIGSYTIRRTTQFEGGTRSLDCVVDEPICMDAGDGRQVTAVQWIEVCTSHYFLA